MCEGGVNKSATRDGITFCKLETFYILKSDQREDGNEREGFSVQLQRHKLESQIVVAGEVTRVSMCLSERNL